MWFSTNDQARRQHVIPLPRLALRQRCAFGLLLIGACSVHGQAPAGAPEESKPPPVLVQKQSAETALRLAETALREKRPADAVDALRAALRLDPSLVDARRSLADTLFEMGRRAEAVPEYEHLLAVRPDAALYDRLINLLRGAGNTIAALGLAQRAALAFPADGRFAAQTVELLLQLGDAKAARDFVDRLPKDAPSDLLRARAAEKLGAWAEAYQAYQRASRAGGGKVAEDGRKKARSHAVKSESWLVFAPAPWEPVAGAAAFQHPEFGVELKLEASTSGSAVEVARGAVSAKFPKSLLAMLPAEERAAIDAKIKEHQPGAEGHFATSDEDRQHASEQLAEEPVRVEAALLDKESAGFAYAVFKSGEEPVGVPVFALVPAKLRLVYVLSGKLDLNVARQLLLAVSAAGVVEESP